MQKALFILSVLKLSEAVSVESNLEAAISAEDQALVDAEVSTLAQTESTIESKLESETATQAEIDAQTYTEELEEKIPENELAEVSSEQMGGRRFGFMPLS